MSKIGLSVMSARANETCEFASSAKYKNQLKLLSTEILLLTTF